MRRLYCMMFICNLLFIFLWKAHILTRNGRASAPTTVKSGGRVIKRIKQKLSIQNKTKQNTKKKSSNNKKVHTTTQKRMWITIKIAAKRITTAKLLYKTILNAKASQSPAAIDFEMKIHWKMNCNEWTNTKRTTENEEVEEEKEEEEGGKKAARHLYPLGQFSNRIDESVCARGFPIYLKQCPTVNPNWMNADYIHHKGVYTLTWADIVGKLEFKLVILWSHQLHHYRLFDQCARFQRQNILEPHRPRILYLYIFKWRQKNTHTQNKNKNKK